MKIDLYTKKSFHGIIKKSFEFGKKQCIKKRIINKKKCIKDEIAENLINKKFRQKDKYKTY